MSKICPQFGNSDHNTILLLPSYRQALKRSKPVVKNKQVWTSESIEKLRACFDCTNWDSLLDASNSTDEVVSTVTDYIKFCTGMLIPSSTKRIYPNHKPWISSELKTLLQEKRRLFATGQLQRVKELQRTIGKKIKLCKVDYKNRLEKNFQQNNPRVAWQAMQTMTGYKSKKQMVAHSNDFVNELNNFYCRFDTHDFTAENTALECSLANVPLTSTVNINETDVRNVFSGLKLNKAVGPDGISNRVLKSCSHQLANVFTQIFQMTLDEGYIPEHWKMSVIVPVPKQNKATEFNDYRPVALTSNIMKCLERLITRFLTHQASSFLDFSLLTENVGELTMHCLSIFTNFTATWIHLEHT